MRAQAVHASWPGRIVLTLVLLAITLLSLRQVGGPDIGFHLRAGNHLLEGQGWPRTDPFTYTVPDHPYLDTTWGYQLVLAAVERAFSSAGMVLFSTGLVVAVFLLSARTMSLLAGRRRLLAPVLLLLGGIAAEPRFEPRPEVASWLLLALVIYLLSRRAEGLSSPMWALPVIFLVWINTHALFVLGWVALACFLVGGALRRGRIDRSLASWCAACIAVTLVNPYGWRALTFPLTLVTRLGAGSIFKENIGEFGSPLSFALSEQFTFYAPSLASYFALVALVLLALPRLWRHRHFESLFLCLAFLPLSLVAVRNIPLLVVACLGVVAQGFPLGPSRGVLPLSDRSRHRWTSAMLVALAAAAVILAARVRHDAYYVSHRRLDRFGLGWNHGTLPIDAVAFAERAVLDGRVLNHLGFGGYLMWARRGPVFIDGRLEVMGEEFYEEYRHTLENRAKLEAQVVKYDIRWILFPYRLEPALVADLSRDRAWRLAYHDSVAVIFARAGVPVTWPAPEMPRSPELRVEELPGLGGTPRRLPLSLWLSGIVRHESYPIAALNRGIFHFLRAEPSAAAWNFAAALEESRGSYPEIYDNLGAALQTLGRVQEARTCWRIALADLPFYSRTRRRFLIRRLEETEPRR